MHRSYLYPHNPTFGALSQGRARFFYAKAGVALLFSTNYAGHASCAAIRPVRAAPFPAPIVWCTQTAQAVRPIRAKDFRLNQAREYAAPAAGDVRRFRRGNQKGRHLRFLPSWDSRFPLLVSPAKIGERRPLRNWSTTVGLLQRVFLRLFAVHRQRTATQVGNFQQARHNSVAQLFGTL